MAAADFQARDVAAVAGYENQSLVTHDRRFPAGAKAQLRDGTEASKYGGNVRDDVSSDVEEGEAVAAEGFYVVPSPTDKRAIFAVVGT